MGKLTKSLGEIRNSEISGKAILIFIIQIIIFIALGFSPNISYQGLPLIRGIYVPSGFQVVFGIWFGIFGIISSLIGGIFLNLIQGYNIFETLLFSVGDVTMAIIPYFVFRFMKRDSSLKTIEDWLTLIIFGIILSPLIVAFYSVNILFTFNLIPIEEFWISFLFWSTGSIISNSLISPICFLMLSNTFKKFNLIIDFQKKNEE
ncbi:MAG: MASE1 domain-containing protein [Candidatus Ranarchaeia archaeon]